MYLFKRKWRQIKRVIDFLPIIWKGYDWDYRYAVELFQHQLKRTADQIEKKGTRADAKNVASRIRTAVELLEKVYDEEYQYEYAVKIQDKYGPYEQVFKPVVDGSDEHWDLVEEYEAEYTEEELALIREERHQLMLDSSEKQNRAHRIVWQYIQHNIRRWWD